MEIVKLLCLLTLLSVGGCSAMAQKSDEWIAPLRITRAYTGDPRPVSEVARIRSHSMHSEGLFLADVPGPDNQIKVEVVSANGFAQSPHEGGGHYFEVLPGTCTLAIDWRQVESRWILGAWRFIEPGTAGSTTLVVTVEAGRRYFFKITPTEHGGPQLELK